MEEIKVLNYKESIKKLEEIVKKMESDEPDVDDLSNMVEEALLLLKACKQKLKSTEDNIKKSFDEFE
jgi:exodeoxyribonuclease VII small subunit